MVRPETLLPPTSQPEVCRFLVGQTYIRQESARHVVYCRKPVNRLQRASNCVTVRYAKDRYARLSVCLSLVIHA